MYNIDTISRQTSLIKLNKYLNIEHFLGMCRQCENYNAVWSCPPYNFEPEKLLSGYADVELFGTKITFNAKAHKAYTDKSQAMEFLKTVMYTEKLKADKLVLEMEKTRRGGLALYGGGCRLCETCTRPQQEPCRKPNEMRYSLESLGYDVSAIAGQLLDTPLLWFTDTLPAYMLLVTALLY